MSAEKSDLDDWEYLLYIMALAFTFEGLLVINPTNSFCTNVRFQTPPESVFPPKRALYSSFNVHPSHSSTNSFASSPGAHSAFGTLCQESPTASSSLRSFYGWRIWDNKMPRWIIIGWLVSRCWVMRVLWFGMFLSLDFENGVFMAEIRLGWVRSVYGWLCDVRILTSTVELITVFDGYKYVLSPFLLLLPNEQRLWPDMWARWRSA